jgi:hypothetical protein
MMKTRRMKWAGHVAQMARKGMHIAYCGKFRRNETTRKTKK